MPFFYLSVIEKLINQFFDFWLGNALYLESDLNNFSLCQNIFYIILINSSALKQPSWILFSIMTLIYKDTLACMFAVPVTLCRNSKVDLYQICSNLDLSKFYMSRKPWYIWNCFNLLHTNGLKKIGGIELTNDLWYANIHLPRKIPANLHQKPYDSYPRAFRRKSGDYVIPFAVRPSVYLSIGLYLLLGFWS